MSSLLAEPATADHRVATILATAVAALGPLAAAVGVPLRVAAALREVDAVRNGLAELTERLASRDLVVVPDDEPSRLTVFDRIATRHLRANGLELLAADRSWPPGQLALTASTVAERSLDRITDRRLVAVGDGAVLRACALGSPDRPALVVVGACGMPTLLSGGWLRALARTHYVVTWESRGLFPPPAADEPVPSYGLDLAAQVADLFAVMDEFGLASAGAIGLCGGAIVALAAAAESPRIASLSLWHGDYNAGDATAFQRNLKALMAMVGKDPATAGSVYRGLCVSGFSSAPADLAHLVVVPYATPESLLRYGRLNGSLMNADVGRLAGAVGQPALVVTSDRDEVAHPEGSRQVARLLPRGRLHVQAGGAHLDAFTAPPHFAELARDFHSAAGAAHTRSRAGGGAARNRLLTASPATSV